MLSLFRFLGVSRAESGPINLIFAKYRNRLLRLRLATILPAGTDCRHELGELPCNPIMVESVENLPTVLEGRHDSRSLKLSQMARDP